MIFCSLIISPTYTIISLFEPLTMADQPNHTSVIHYHYVCLTEMHIPLLISLLFLTYYII